MTRPCRRGWLGVVGAVLSLVGAPRAAWAQLSPDCGSTTRPIIVLTTKVKPPDQIIADALRDHLRASLDARDIALCAEPSAASDPVGHVLLEVTRAGSGAITARIVIGDDITDKRVERTMDLTSIPEDARPLAVSTSGDELLRASWAELLIADAPPPKRAPPKAIVESVANSLRSIDELLDLAPPDPPPPVELLEHAFQAGLLGHGMLFEHLVSFGGDLRLGYWYREQFGVHAGARLSFSTARGGRNGSVRQQTQGGALGLAYAFWPVRGLASLAAEVDLSLHRVQLLPTRGRAAALERAADDWTLETSVGPRGYLTFAPVQLSLGMAMRIAVRPTQASDGGQVLLSNNRVGGEATLGFHVVL
jgi:hypothetical protein